MHQCARRGIGLSCEKHKNGANLYLKTHLRSGVAEAGGRAAVHRRGQFDGGCAEILRTGRHGLSRRAGDAGAAGGQPNLDCFRSYQIEPKEDGVGFDIYLLAEHRTTLSEYLADNAITHLCAVNLAMDLCSALVDLRAAGLVHRDVKPGNIYLNSQGHFVLGDLGIAKIEN